MSDIATQLCEAVPPEPLSIADVLAIKQRADPDIDPRFGLQPAPGENVVVLHVTDAPPVSYLGLEDHGWMGIDSASLETSQSVEATIEGAIEMALEWADTYYSSSSIAMLQRSDR